MFDQKEQKNVVDNENYYKRVPGSAGKAIQRSSSIDNSNSAVGASLNNSSSAFCISLQNSTDLSDSDDRPGDYSDDSAKASGKPFKLRTQPSTNAHDSLQHSKHSARSRGKSTDRFHPSDSFHERDNDVYNISLKENIEHIKEHHRNLKRLSKNGPANKPTNKPSNKPTNKPNHLTKRNSVDHSLDRSSIINGRFIKIWIETRIGTAYEVAIRPDEPIFNLKLKLEIEENIPVLYQTLYYGDDELNDSFTIEEYEIENGATLKLQVQDKNSAKAKSQFADAPATFAIDERTYNLLVDETAEKKQAHKSASLTDSKSIDEFRMLNAASNLGCISVAEHKIADESEGGKDPQEKREKMEQLMKKMQKWSKFQKQAIKLPNLNDNNINNMNASIMNGNLDEGRRVELGSSSSLNGMNNLSIPNSLSSPNNLTILGKKKGKEPLNEPGDLQGKRLSNQFEKKNFSIRKGFQFFPRFRSNSSFNLVSEYEGDGSEEKSEKKLANSENDERRKVERKDESKDSKLEHRPSSVPHATERKPPIAPHKFVINKLFGQRNLAGISKKAKLCDPEKKNKKAKNSSSEEEQREDKRDKIGGHLSDDRVKPLPRKLPPVEATNKKETKSQRCPKCQKRPCKCEPTSENCESKEDTFIDKLDKAKSKKKFLPKI